VQANAFFSEDSQWWLETGVSYPPAGQHVSYRTPVHEDKS
jgi:hypothetical protein